MGKGVLRMMLNRCRLQFYIRPVVAGQSLRALMESADPRLISPEGSNALVHIQAWWVPV